MKYGLTTLGLLWMVSSAQAVDLGPEVELNGSLLALAWNSDMASLSHGSGLGGRLQLEARYRTNNWTGFVRGDAYTRSELADPRGSNRVREAWARYQGQMFDLTVGRQLMPIGRTDVVILQDQFAPRDLTQMTLTETEQQLGVMAARLDVYPTNALTVTGALIQQDRGYVLPKTWNASDGVSLTDQPKSAGLLRIEYRGEAWEVAGTVSRGASPLRGISLGTGSPTWAVPDESRVSFDGTMSFGKDVLRWDFVHARTEAGNMPGFGSERRALSIGLDQGLWSDATLSFQAIVRHHQLENPQARENSVLFEVFDGNTRLSQSFRGTEHYFITTLKQNIRAEHQLECGVFLGQNAERGVQMRWVWRPRDNYVLRAKAQQQQGGEDTLLGNLGFKRLLYVEGGYQF